ncbi:Vacuolar protein sorting-associated protein 27 [Psilocybe cubensis]|uniref:Vacuolar protein sorting-associated protein 27 n=2 Tax=Psilocybe cubensis TaxID=181762 RepID=A0ACB8HIK5_PSICU|nr:Vacuolar protein sorting-associated protein 27 [Psilocybe cubensis]KAH9487189.1 Vacuolar protein sorting-associated protein 27 [Psilocybe cubensis]
MSTLGAWLWGSSQLDDAIDKATSELLPAGGEDIALNLEICDQIRSKSVPAKDAMRALKRRLNHKNPNVQLLALSLTDICIKNGGDLFLTEVASREFMDNLVSILKMPALNHDVKEMILRLVQNWSVAFEGKPTLSYVGQVYKTLTNEGYKFPPKDMAVANSAMVDTQTAPEWIDSDLCLRCRTPFSFTNRKHHCRNCGQVFDQACSSKTMALPHFGIAQEVRVCDGCHSKLTKKAERADKGHRHSTSLHGHRHKSARELADAELQRAIQLSLQEVHGSSHAGYAPSQPSPTKWGYSEPPIVDRGTYPGRKAAVVDDDDDPDLRAAIEASLREANAPKPSAPVVIETPRLEEPSYAGPGYSQSYPPSVNQSTLPQIPNYDLEPLEADVILTFNQTVEQVQAQGGRDLSRYPAVSELYEKASGLRPKLALSLDDTGRKEQMLSEMHEQLSQAVKLYDQILSQQVAQPRWRAPAAASVSPTPYQQQMQQSYGSNYAANGYVAQWAPQQQQSQPEPRREPLSPTMSFSASLVQEPRYGLTSRPELSQQQTSQQHEQVRQQTSYQPQYTTAPLSAPPPPQISPGSAPPLHSTQYTQPQQYQQYPVSISTAGQTSSHAGFAQSPPTTSSISSTPSAVPQSPPPSLYQQPTPQAPESQSSFTTSLNRQNSVAYAPAALSPPSNITRSNTVASQAPTQYQRQQYQTPAPPQQHQHAYQVSSPPPAPVSLMQFPTAPTDVPQPAFPAYNPLKPSEYEHKEERKEALLIDL